MTRKSYTDLQEALREAQQYINVLIHDNTYGVINAHAYPHEYARIKDQARYLATVWIEPLRNPSIVKRALHVRHPGVVLIASPIENIFVCILAHNPESWCNRVKSTMRKGNQDCTIAYTPTAGNPALDLLTCLELIKLTNPPDITDTLKEIPQ
jgi:hypothetical protein